MSDELVANGHEYDPGWISRPLQPDETTESVLNGHSEKLAIAYNFVVNPNTKRIQIVKNLRVCGDCREYHVHPSLLALAILFSLDKATKLLAAIRQCEIIVRDANRVHHFHTNGQCSCQDYF